MSDIESPCIHICKTDPDSGLCIGCSRTLDEIEEWEDYTDEQRAAIMKALDIRKELVLCSNEF